MSTDQMPNPSTRQPYPRYLMDLESRKLIERMEEDGLMVDIVAPAVGSVEITVTAPDGTTHCVLGRPEELAHTIRNGAALCGFELPAVG